MSDAVGPWAVATLDTCALATQLPSKITTIMVGVLSRCVIVGGQ